MMAGHVLISGIFRNEVEEQALVAGMGVLRVAEIQTGKRIFEHRSRLPRGTHGAAIAAMFQEAEFELQHFQQVAIVFRHISLRRWMGARERERWQAVLQPARYCGRACTHWL